jgi:hypothetical protein
MERHQIIADIRDGNCRVKTEAVVEIEPGKEFIRDGRGGYRDIAADDLHSGELFVISRWHGDIASARAEVAAELERRAKHLSTLADTCLGRACSDA